MALDGVSTFLPKCWKVLTSLDVCGKIVPKQHTKKIDLMVRKLMTLNPAYCADTDCTALIRLEYISSEANT